jgi:hypothetical protein
MIKKKKSKKNKKESKEKDEVVYLFYSTFNEKIFNDDNREKIEAYYCKSGKEEKIRVIRNCFARAVKESNFLVIEEIIEFFPSFEDLDQGLQFMFSELAQVSQVANPSEKGNEKIGKFLTIILAKLLLSDSFDYHQSQQVKLAEKPFIECLIKYGQSKNFISFVENSENSKNDRKQISGLEMLECLRENLIEFPDLSEIVGKWDDRKMMDKFKDDINHHRVIYGMLNSSSDGTAEEKVEKYILENLEDRSLMEKKDEEGKEDIFYLLKKPFESLKLFQLIYYHIKRHHEQEGEGYFEEKLKSVVHHQTNLEIVKWLFSLKSRNWRPEMTVVEVAGNDDQLSGMKQVYDVPIVAVKDFLLARQTDNSHYADNKSGRRKNSCFWMDSEQLPVLNFLLSIHYSCYYSSELKSIFINDKHNAIDQTMRLLVRKNSTFENIIDEHMEKKFNEKDKENSTFKKIIQQAKEKLALVSSLLVDNIPCRDVVNLLLHFL